MPFTKRELSVLYLLSKGMSRAAVARQLNIAVSTFESHKQSINKKLAGTGIKLNDLKELSPELLEAWIKQQDEQLTDQIDKESAKKQIP
jgi:hypothetical protein